MGGKVYANGREISGKKSGHKVLGAMPDVCLSPPSPPAGPVPVPYPNFSDAGDTAEGSKSVKIGGKPVGLKNKSSYKKSKGDEAATRNFGMGVVSHAISGPSKYVSWSFDVKIEGENVIRHLDLTMGNHGSPSNGPTAPAIASQAVGTAGEATCKELQEKNKERREELGQRKQKTTITHAVYVDGGKKQQMWATSRALTGKYKAGCANRKGFNWVRGQKRSRIKERDKLGRRKTESAPTAVSCDESRGFEYRARRANPQTSHTESRIIETIFRNAGKEGPKGTLLMSIDWNVKEEGRWLKKKTCCKACQRLLCAAQLCGMRIVLCDKNNRPVPQNTEKCDPEDLS